MRCAECKHWRPRQGNWGKCVRLSKWQGSPLVIMDDRGNGVETENSFSCVCHEERTAVIAEEKFTAHNKPNVAGALVRFRYNGYGYTCNLGGKREGWYQYVGPLNAADRSV